VQPRVFFNRSLKSPLHFLTLSHVMPPRDSPYIRQQSPLISSRTSLGGCLKPNTSIRSFTEINSTALLNASSARLKKSGYFNDSNLFFAFYKLVAECSFRCGIEASAAASKTLLTKRSLKHSSSSNWLRMQQTTPLLNVAEPE
jgi:hypothetical protein